MGDITIDGTKYDSDDLSDEGKNLLQSLQFMDNEIKRLNAKLAAYQTARNAYGQGLKRSLEGIKSEADPEVDLPENISFD